MLHHTVFRNLDVETYPRVMNSGSDAGSLLFVEFAADSIIDVEQKLTSCKDKLSYASNVLETVTDENSSKQIWGARKSALNNAMKMTVGSRKPVGLIEDTVVSPKYFMILYSISTTRI